MGRFEDEQEDGVTLVPADAKDFVDIFARITGTSTNPALVHIAPGIYNVTGPVRLNSNVTLIGSGAGSCIIQRTTSQDNIHSRSANGSDFSDPVVDVSGCDNVMIRGITVIHSGAITGLSSQGVRFPVALSVSDATRLTLEDSVFDGTAVGMWGLGQDSQSAKAITDPLNWVKANGCDFIGNFCYGATLVQRVFFANGCRFIIDTTGQVHDCSVINTIVVAYRNHEYVNAQHRGCLYMVLLADTYTGPSAGTNYIAGLTATDTASSSEMHIAGCQAAVRVTGNIDASPGTGSVFLAACIVGGDNNQLHAEGCEFTYETPSGGLTDCDAVGAFLIYASTGAATQEAYLHGCNLWDKGGTGGTVRKDVLYKTDIVTGAPDIFQLYGCRARSIGQFGTGGSTARASVMAIQADTVSFQGASAQFASAATASVSLPIAYEASGTNYKVFCESDSNETIWVTAKTNSGFQLNSSNAASTAIIHYLVRR